MEERNHNMDLHADLRQITLKNPRENGTMADPLHFSPRCFTVSFLVYPPIPMIRGLLQLKHLISQFWDFGNPIDKFLAIVDIPSQ